MSPGTFLLITLTIGAGVAALPLLAALIARRFDPDADWGAPVVLMAGLLAVVALVLWPFVAVLAFFGARTIAGYLAAVEVIALTASVMLFLLLRLR